MLFQGQQSIKYSRAVLTNDSNRKFSGINRQIAFKRTVLDIVQAAAYVNRHSFNAREDIGKTGCNV